METLFKRTGESVSTGLMVPHVWLIHLLNELRETFQDDAAMLVAIAIPNTEPGHLTSSVFGYYCDTQMTALWSGATYFYWSPFCAEEVAPDPVNVMSSMKPQWIDKSWFYYDLLGNDINTDTSVANTGINRDVILIVCKQSLF